MMYECNGVVAGRLNKTHGGASHSPFDRTRCLCAESVAWVLGSVSIGQRSTPAEERKVPEIKHRTKQIAPERQEGGQKVARTVERRVGVVAVDVAEWVSVVARERRRWRIVLGPAKNGQFLVFPPHKFVCSEPALTKLNFINDDAFRRKENLRRQKGPCLRAHSSPASVAKVAHLDTDVDFGGRPLFVSSLSW